MASKYSLKLAAVDAYSKTFGDFGKKAEALQAEVKNQRAELDRLNRTARQADGFAKLGEKVEKTTGLLQAARTEQSQLAREHKTAAARVERLAGEYGQASAALKALQASSSASTAEVRRREGGR